jgi:hypothetical protein
MLYNKKGLEFGYGIRFFKKLINYIIISISKVLLVFKLWWPPSYLLSCMLIVLMVKKILMKICCFNTLFCAHRVENIILFIFKLSKLTVFIFELFQSPKLIK